MIEARPTAAASSGRALAVLTGSKELTFVKLEGTLQSPSRELHLKTW
jgi:hypothetical protein